MANIQKYPRKDFSTQQTFLAYDPSQGTVRVSGQDIVDSIDLGTPIQLLQAEVNERVQYFRTTDLALLADLPISRVIYTTGASAENDGLGGHFVVVAAGTPDSIPMDNGNALLQLEFISQPVTYINSVADIAGFVGAVNEQQISMKGWHPGSDVGGGMLYWDADKPKADHNGGTVFSPTVPFGTVANYLGGVGETDPAGSGCWVRVAEEYCLVEHFGADPGQANNSPSYNALIAASDDGTKVVWGGPGIYVGHFISEQKSFRLDLNGATLVNDNNSLSICQIGSFVVNEYDVTEAVLNHGDRTFTIAGASSLFSVGDVGYLWDGAIRPTGGDVNYEVVKIEDITGDVITVAGFLASYKGAAAIRFYHSPVQLKNAEISNGFIRPSNTHVSFGVACLNVDGATIKKVNISGHYGNAVGVRFCYGVGVSDIVSARPRAVGSGEGYGVALNAVSQFTVRDVRGDGNRHIYDQDSAYFGLVENISDMDDKSSPVTLAHNGFAGYITCNDIRCRTTQYPINFSAQGYGGSPGALAINHPYRNIVIDGVTSVVPSSKTASEFNVAGVYIQNSVENIDIRNVTVRYENNTPITTSSSSLVRVEGSCGGYFRANNLSVNQIGIVFYGNGPDTATSRAELTGVFADRVSYVAILNGRWGLSLDNVTINNEAVGVSYVLASGGNPVEGIYIGENLKLATTKPILSNSGAITSGSLPLRSDLSGSAIIVSAGQSLTPEQIQWSSMYCSVVGPVGAGTVILSATSALPKPMINGASLTLAHKGSGRQNVEFPAGDNIHEAFTLTLGESLTLISYSGKWGLAGVSSIPV